VKLLLKYNATADFANGKGTTALMRASQEGHMINRLRNTKDYFSNYFMSSPSASL
jgi:hypothetical protein